MNPTDIAAWIGALAGVTALAWQVLTWRRSTHRVKVFTSNAITDVATPGRAEHYVAVEARNLGSSAVEVVRWGIALPRRRNMWMTNSLPISARLPYRLEPGASTTFYVEGDAVREAQRQHGVPFRGMRPFVELGTGQRVHATRAVPLE